MIRGNEVTLENEQCLLDIRKFSCSQRTVKEWNVLSADHIDRKNVKISEYV